MTPSTAAPFATIDDAVADLRAGKFIVVVDDEDRENEGDSSLPPRSDTPRHQLHGSGGAGFDLPRLTEDRCDALGLPRWSGEHLELRHGITSRSKRGAARPPASPQPTGRDGADRDRSEDPPRGSRPTRPHVSAAGAGGRGAEARRPDGGLGGSCPDRGTRSLPPSAKS